MRIIRERYVLQDYAKGWGVPSTSVTDASTDVPGAPPTPMETGTAAEEEEDAADSAATAATPKGWKGKGKQRAGKARTNRVETPGSQVSLISPIVLTPL